METLNIIVVVLFFILYIVFVSRISDKNNRLLKDVLRRAKQNDNSTTKEQHLDSLFNEMKLFKKRAYKTLLIFLLIQEALHLILNIDAIIQGWYFYWIPYLLISLGLFIFFLFTLYVILSVLKGRGTIDSRPAKNQQFPFPL